MLHASIDMSEFDTKVLVNAIRLHTGCAAASSAGTGLSHVKVGSGVDCKDRAMSSIRCSKTCMW